MKDSFEYDDAYLSLCIERAFQDPANYKVPLGITRYDYSDSHSWWLRITRDTAQFKEHFYDHQHGSIENALREAIIRRHEILSAFPATIKHIRSKTISPNPEERIMRLEAKGNLQPYIGWRATFYNQNHERKTKVFSVMKFGEDEARMLALAYTKKHHNLKPKITKHPDLYQIDKVKVFSRSDIEILSTINSGKYGKKGGAAAPIFDSDPFGFEGEQKLVIHRSIERDKALRTAKINQFLGIHGALFCELCNFNFKSNYPFLLNNIIEVHHIIPLATLQKGCETRLADLILLCSNCHFAVHQGDAEKNLISARRHFEKLRVSAT